MIILFVFILLFAVVAAVVAHKSRAAGSGSVSSFIPGRFWSSPAASRDHRPIVKRSNFRAVSIRCGTGSCRAARRLAGKRAFPGQIPRLPLSQCDALTCTCIYTHHDDRRYCEERREPYASFAAAPPDGGERRDRPDRRLNKG